MAKPLAAALHHDTSEFFSEIINAIWAVARSGLRMGHPSAINSSSALVLIFSYSRRPANLRDRFTFVTSRVTALDELIKKHSRYSQPVLPREKVNRTQEQEIAEGMASGMCLLGAVDQDVRGNVCKFCAYCPFFFGQCFN